MNDRSDRADGDGFQCPHDGGFDTELGLLGCVLDLHKLACVCRAKFSFDNVIASPPSGNAGEGAVAWRVRFADGRCTSWFDGKPPNHHGPYEFAYAAPPQPPPDAVREALKAIEAKIAQLEHYRDNECQLEHARTIADGRILQARQDVIVIDRAMKQANVSTPLPSGEHPNNCAAVSPALRSTPPADGNGT